MFIRSKQIDTTAENLNVLLLGETENGMVDTLPEVFEYIRNGGFDPSSGDTSDIIPISNEELDFICQ